MAEIWKSTSSFSYGSHCEKATAALEQTEIYIFQPQQHIKRPIMAEIAATNCRLRCTHKSRVSNLVFPLPVELVRS